LSFLKQIGKCNTRFWNVLLTKWDKGISITEIAKMLEKTEDEIRAMLPC
jgi:hypothetical protein